MPNLVNILVNTAVIGTRLDGRDPTTITNNRNANIEPWKKKIPHGVRVCTINVFVNIFQIIHIDLQQRVSAVGA